MTQVIRRRAVRAVLIAPGPQVLLIHVAFQGRFFWVAPGGGIQAGETSQTALIRELHEELGMGAAEIGPMLWRREVCSSYQGREWRQYEEYFAVHSDRFHPEMLDPTEARHVRELRWWDLDDLDRAPGNLAPASLSAIVRGYLANGAPASLPGIEIVRDRSADQA